MTSIVSIVAAFMATFMLVFGYLTYTDEGPAEAPPKSLPLCNAELLDRHTTRHAPMYHRVSLDLRRRVPDFCQAPAARPGRVDSGSQVDARALVLDGHLDAPLLPPPLDPHLATGLEGGIHGVRHEVDEELVQLVAVGRDHHLRAHQMGPAAGTLAPRGAVVRVMLGRGG